MPDPSQKPLVGQLNAQKAVVAEHVENVDITSLDKLSVQAAIIAGRIENLNITNLIRGIDELQLATRYDSRVQNFLEYYLGAKDHPAPFGGRAADLTALDAWLDDPAAPPYAALIAPAGRGKSALLAHWVTHLAERSATSAEAVHIVYFPISIRFNTNLETVVFASLAGRMAHVYGEKVTQAVDAQQYRGVFSDYLRRTPPNGGRVLVVMDGLDEAASWEAGADLFPTVAPGHLRVIVAARPLALDKDETTWLNRLGWEMPNRAQRLSLEGLDREGVRDVLSQMGNPLDALATKIDLISRLYELSAGDPLLVRLYVEALLPQGAQAATLTPEDLAKLQPGLEAYFKRWFEEQQKLWGAAKPLQDKTVRGLLNLCAAALGPLKKDDV
ncbi:MAG: ATP-binding protein, partial [Beijerinckiaceae bacterium]|nr:ATP-binding protein [Beijerinckiaceae bacterium]